MDLRKVTKREERLGATKVNNFGSVMIVSEYNTALDIMVYFPKYDSYTHTNWQKFEQGAVHCAYEPRFYGVAYIGEGKYKTSINRKRTKAYDTWRAMIERCYSDLYKHKNPTYKGCKVCDEWLCFQNFAEWFYENYYEVGQEQMNLDKDILVKGNKIYSPSTCIFVPKKINLLFIKRDSCRGDLPVGVVLEKEAVTNPYRATVTGNIIGWFKTPHEAFLSYKLNKELLIQSIAEEYRDKIPNKLYEAMINYKVEEND